MFVYIIEDRHYVCINVLSKATHLRPLHAGPLPPREDDTFTSELVLNFPVT